MLKVLRAVFGRPATMKDDLDRKAASYKILALEEQVKDLCYERNAQTQQMRKLENERLMQSATLAKYVKTIKRLRKRCTEMHMALGEASRDAVTGFDIAVAEGLGALAYEEGRPTKSALPGGGLLGPTDVAFNLGWWLADTRKRAAETLKAAQEELVPTGARIELAIQAGRHGYENGEENKTPKGGPLSWEGVLYNFGWSYEAYEAGLRRQLRAAEAAVKAVRETSGPTAMEVASMFAQGRMARADNKDRPATTAQNAATWKGAVFNLGWFAEDDKRRLEDEVKAKPSDTMTYDDALRDFLAGLNNEILPFNAGRPLHGTSLYVFGALLRDVNRAADRFKQALAKKE